MADRAAFQAMDDIPAPFWTLDTFLHTIHRGDVGLWSWNPQDRSAFLDDLSQEFWGGLHECAQSIDTLFERIDPRIQGCLDTGDILLSHRVAL